MSPILKEFPSRFESERLIIRAPRPGDGDQVREAVLESIEELRLWLPWAMGFTHDASLLSECRNHLTNELRDTMIFSKVQP